MRLNILESVILGVEKGLSKFVPISSTWHLILASALLKIIHTGLSSLSIR
jgi:undecaprenyl pyrophosphate phosphatase UppP